MFDEIRQRVREGRWAIVGGWFLQPDCNAPGGESFARHSLIAQRYFCDKFGVTAQTGYNVDSFGHNASLPMILRLSGMENYVFMRPAPHENGDLYDLFNWRSADGSTVRCFRAEHTNGDDRYGSAFRARVPALGYAVYRIFTEGEAAPAQEVRAGHDLLENDRVRIEFDEKTGEIVRYLRKDTGEELLSHSTGTVLLDETDCDTWAHNKTSLGQPCGSFGDARIEVVERGCVRSTLRATSHFGASTLIRDYTLENGSDALRVTLTVDFHEKHRAFKLTLPAGDAVRAAIPFGSIERPCGTGEEPCGEWLASGGLGYAGDVSCGYDAADGDFRPTLFRSAIYADHYGNRDEFCEYMEQGVSQFRYLLFPYTAPADAKRRADELNSGLRAVHDTFHDGSLPGKARGVGGGGDSLVVTAVKRGEEGGDVLRFVELNGEPARGTLTLFGKGIPFETQPHELHTYRDGSPVNLVEWPQL